MNKQKDPPLCKEHGVKKIRPYNSTILICPECEHQKRLASSKARISKNKELLKQSYSSDMKTSNTARKTENRTKSGRQKAMDRADRYFSIYVRITKAFIISNGEPVCKDIITGKPYKAKSIDNGHLFSRKFKTLRYEIDDCWPQNRSSNRFSGEADHYKFKDKVLSIIGQERLDRLEQLRKEIGEDSIEFYEEQATKWLVLINQLAKENDIKKWW